eukprot:scaffold122234_cov36-Phaeocystis_antarctica.AAC.1
MSPGRHTWSSRPPAVPLDETSRSLATETAHRLAGHACASSGRPARHAGSLTSEGPVSHSSQQQHRL